MNDCKWEVFVAEDKMGRLSREEGSRRTKLTPEPRQVIRELGQDMNLN